MIVKNFDRNYANVDEFIKFSLIEFREKKEEKKTEFIWISIFVFLFIILGHSGVLSLAQKNPSQLIWIFISILSMTLFYFAISTYVYICKIKDINELIRIVETYKKEKIQQI